MQKKLDDSVEMRQRVMIARALAFKPKLILADESTTALDVTIQAQILTLLSRLCKEQAVGLVLVTHNLGIVARYAKRVVVMYGGRFITEADVSQLYTDPRHPCTQGLLLPVPRMDASREMAPKPIAGTPPDPLVCLMQSLVKRAYRFSDFYHDVHRQ
jgi:oligopeptide transport system ATP-binding protein